MLVIKIGGAAGLNYDLLCEEIRALHDSGERIVVVHGGSAETDALAEQLGHPMRTITSPSGHASRYTDRRTLEIFAMATARVSRTLVERLQGIGVNALGLSGIDGRLLRASRKEAVRSVEDGRVRIVRDDWTGSITSVNAALLAALLDAGYLPVVAPLAISERGEMLNVDGDRAAGAIAGVLRADRLLLLTNVAGLMRHFPDETTLVRQLRHEELKSASEWAAGRMKRKLIGANEALQSGVREVIIGDGRRATPIHDALAGAGTRIG